MQDAIKALAKAQTEMGKVLKNSENPHLRKKYADLGAVIDACFGALHANGFAIMQPCGADEGGQYVETILAHASGHTFTSRVYLIVDKQDMQRVGSAITYARRYGLLGMAGLAPEDDDGEATKAPPRQQSSAPQNKPARLEQTPHEAMRVKLLENVQHHDKPKFQADLETLRKLNPEAAAQVEVRILQVQQEQAA